VCANLEIGFHEQTRLQPEIGRGAGRSLSQRKQFTLRLLRANFPFYGMFASSWWLARRLLGRRRRWIAPSRRYLADLSSTRCAASSPKR